MIHRHTKHAYIEFIIKNSKKWNPELILINSKIKDALKGDFDSNLQQCRI